jgi:endonuclease-8
MPEGDTVWRTARRLDHALAGQVTTLCDLRFPGVATTDLRGATTTAVVARGKHLLHRFDSGVTLHSHLRMEGQWRLERPADAAAWLRRTTLRAAVGTDHWVALGMRLGMLDVVATTAEDSVVGHLGPDVLGADWDAARAAQNLRDSGQEIGAALLDQRHLAGVGTIWASEALYLERIGPWTPVADLEPELVDTLVARVHRLMDAAKEHSAPSSTGYREGENTSVHGRSGRPCRRCGATVRVAPSGPPPRDRTLFYCPACQGGIGRTDDGRPQQPLGSSGARTTRQRER